MRGSQSGADGGHPVTLPGSGGGSPAEADLFTTFVTFVVLRD